MPRGCVGNLRRSMRGPRQLSTRSRKTKHRSIVLSSSFGWPFRHPYSKRQVTLGSRSLQAVFHTSMLQKKASLLEKAAKGELRISKASDADSQLSRALEERERLMKFLRDNSSNADLQPALERLYLECAAADC